jgi:hypothetical protein
MKDKNMAVLGIGTAQALGFFFIFHVLLELFKNFYLLLKSSI